MNKAVSKGFTIVELLVAIVVIAILAVIVVAGYNAVVANAYDSAVKADLAKLADDIKLKTLDDGIVPDGGATSSNTGDSTSLPGISFKPSSESYDSTVSNLYYCAGDVNGSKEYAMVAQSQSGRGFVFRSTSGLSDLTEYTLTSANAGVAVCGAIGFTAPFTWSYGYNPNVGTRWFAWADDGSRITNLVPNPNLTVGTTHWTTNTSWTSARVLVSGSDYAYRVTRTSTAAAGVYINNAAGNELVTEPGQSFTASMTVTASANEAVYIAIRDTVGSSANLVLSNYSLVANVPQRISVTGTATDTGVHIALISGVGAVNNTITVDKVMFTKGTQLYNFADGSSPNWGWVGTADNSPSIGRPL